MLSDKRLSLNSWDVNTKMKKQKTQNKNSCFIPNKDGMSVTNLFFKKGFKICKIRYMSIVDTVRHYEKVTCLLIFSHGVLIVNRFHPNSCLLYFGVTW